MPASTMQPNLDQLAGLTGVRAGALLRWQATGWPDRRAEQWRFTRLSSVEKMDLRPAEMAAKQPAAVAASLPDNAVILSFSNGVLDMAGLAALPGGVIASLLSDNDAALAALAELVPAAHPISNLSLAAMTTGLHLDIAGTVEVPIILAFTGDDNGVSAHPVISVRLADGASAVMAEWHQSSVGLSAPLMGIIVGDKARLDYAKVQQESSASAHLAATGLKLGEGSVFEGFQISAGGQLARLETHIVLSGENADCTLSAIYLGRGKQHHDITTNMNHAEGHCLSNQIIRGVLDDSARGVFQGKVHVAPDAQKTDGQQMSRALLLSRKAEADAKPELEIYADDVLCAHGATVGELDDTQLFYLTSRGIDRKTARSMLIAAFLDDAIDSITHPALADMLRPVTTAWMNATPNAGDL
ncbi:MAG: Fe-S cluster assembly protein SufD [Proteobacteria bacterium]|nr:Fe-S cluster assembly protein SufD [Pseudomonadota bacterium]MDA0960115.1 Fe-S cluster assembly protein SufD [Pseudomonadota bacterium]